MKSVRIDFVSDIACPWCAIGLTALEQAVDQVSDRVSVEIHTQPFELNPQMPPGGRDVFEYLSEKYGNPIS
ncbi:MAG: DsbA family oxidoreductase, partial [Burkholderiaceae bacterium]|nr:DsbA family oxidoreductase [Burkholderiaceae bacterium]